MSAWAAPGVKCVCIHRGRWKQIEGRDPGVPKGSNRHPAFNEICTISRARTRRSGAPSVEIEGYPFNEYHVRWFRPLTSPKGQDHDVALFLHHLDGLRIGEPA